MSVKEQTRTEVAPRVFNVDEAHVFLNWIAEGTDGYLYLVPSEPGGWKLRHKYDGQGAALKPVSPEKARAIMEFVGGACKEWGPVVIAEGSTISYWSASIDDSSQTSL